MELIFYLVKTREKLYRTQAGKFEYTTKAPAANTRVSSQKV